MLCFVDAGNCLILHLIRTGWRVRLCLFMYTKAWFTPNWLRGDKYVTQISYTSIGKKHSCVWTQTLNQLPFTSRVPVGGKSSVCLICMKYRIIILIIIIKRLGEILLSYIAQPHHARTHIYLYADMTRVYNYRKSREWPSTHAVSITALHGR